MLGILIHGDSHFIVRGPAPGSVPDDETARALVKHWLLITIGATTPAGLAQWEIVGKAFREDLQWAVVILSKDVVSAAVQILVQELAERGVNALIL